MATIVNNQPPDRTIVEREDSSGGWAVAVVILLVVVAAGIFFWMRYDQTPGAPAQDGATNINVTLPAGTPGTGTPAN